MKKLPLISLVSFFILIPTITLAKSEDGYEYNENGYNHRDRKWEAITQVLI